jgi:hypothetical protein
MGDMALEIQPRPFTVAEYHRMAEAGILGARERVELLGGVIVAMPPIGLSHWTRNGSQRRYSAAFQQPEKW